MKKRVPVINLNIDYDSVFLPVYKPLRETDARLKFLYGGRDSGKSRDIAMRKIIECLMKPHFRCILIKKTFNSIKDSQWQLIKDICEEWNIEHLFHFKTSPLEITCINGNKFICRGMDDPAKIKSINEPSEAWIEEGNQLSLEDWIYIITTLRSSRGPVGIEMSFNTETTIDFEEFWLYKEYFSHTTEKSFTHTKDLSIGDEKIEIKYIAVHSTYHDNKYVSAERKAYHEGLKTLNYYWYRTFTLGEWGNEENDSPWLFAFDKKKHLSPAELFAKKSETLYLSWDFNRNPGACSVIQWYDDTVFIIEVFKIPNVGTEGICEKVLEKYPGFLYLVTGDYSGDTVSSIYKEQVTNFTMIKNKLRLNSGQIKISPNPKLEKNRTLVNSVFHGYNILLCPVKAKAAIYDCENVKSLADGTIEKKNRKDPAQQADCFTGDTLILTNKGNVRIDEINIDDLVLTRKGYKRVIDKWDSLAEVWEFEFSNGNKIKCTKDHKFYNIHNGFIPIFRIFKEKLKVCQYKGEQSLKRKQKSKELFIMEDVITNIQIKNIFTHPIRKTIADACIVKNGLMRMVKYRKVLMFIIETIMHLIMNFQITNLKRKAYTKASIQKKELKKTQNFLLNFKKRELQLPRNGINHQMELNGIDRMPSTVISGINHTGLKNVNHVLRNLRQKTLIQDSAPTHVNLHGEEKIIQTKKWLIAKPVELNLKPLNTYRKNTAQKNANLRQTHTAMGVKRAILLSTQKVYDITVEEEHEFYANGILVHNCLDTIRYFINQFLGWFAKIPVTEVTGAAEKYVKKINEEEEEDNKYHPNVIGDAIKAIDTGKLVICTKNEYRYVRTAILDYAGKCVELKDGVKAAIALNEVRRLDGRFN